MRWLLTVVLAIVGGFAGAAAWDYSGLGGRATRDYLYAEPEPQAAAKARPRTRAAAS